MHLHLHVRMRMHMRMHPGLAISAVLKFADNIARVYAHAVAMLATMAISAQLFALPVTKKTADNRRRSSRSRGCPYSLLRAHGLSMLHLIIRPQVTPQLVIGVILVANSTFQYHKVPYMPAAPEPEPKGISPAPADKPLLEAKGDISDTSDGVTATSELEIGALKS